MKRGKDDEKIMGPMFPRLHLNETEKGGPRAPPRNKMALYEQLSIPSQRFNPGVLPLNHPNNIGGFVLPTSSSQGNGLERNFHFPLHMPPSTPTHRAETFRTCQSEGSGLSNSLVQLNQRKKVGDEDDFIVPVFVQSGTGQGNDKTQSSIDKERLTRSPTYAGRYPKRKNVCDKDPKLSTSQAHKLMQQATFEMEECPKMSGLSHSVKSTADPLTRENIEELVKESNAAQNQEYQDFPVTNLSSPDDADTCSLQEFRTGSPQVEAGFVESIGGMEKGNGPHQRSSSHARDDNSYPNEPDNRSEYRGDRTNVSLQVINVDRSDDVSESSMVDSISGFDISPDDVVGVIGQKHFWKARKAIVNQQRVFAVQVFELHRLIKVQQLIAESPHLLLEDGIILGQAPLKGSPAKKLPPKYVVKAPAHIVKCKDDSEKPKHKMEHSAENAVGKTSFSSVKNGSQPSSYGPYLGHSQLAPMATDNKMGPWSFHQSPGHQWLIPVVSPSEGLVYKPYPGPGFMGTVCGGYGPFSTAPLTGNFMHPAYGIPTPPHHQGMGNLPGTTVGHTYFPPYAMPVMNPAMSGSAVEQVNQFTGPGPRCQSQFSEGRSNFNTQHRSSPSMPNQKHGPVPQASKFQASKDSELHGSTASSPCGRPQGVGTGFNSEGTGALPLFPVNPAAVEAACRPRETEQPTRAIKVVPHNPRSATESAARIFQSIQEERKQYDLV